MRAVVKSIETITAAGQKGRRLVCRLERENDKEPVLGGTLVLETTTDVADRIVAAGGFELRVGPLLKDADDEPPPTSQTKHLPPVTVKEGDEPPPPPPVADRSTSKLPAPTPAKEK